MVAQSSANTSGNVPSIPQTAGPPISGISGSYAGRIVSVTEEGGTKQAVIDFALGRMRVTLPPEMAETLTEGDLLKLLFQGGNVRLEKRPANPTGTPNPVKDLPVFSSNAVTFTPSGALPTIRDLIDFEEALIEFLSAQTGRPALPATLTPEALPVLLLRVLESPGGKDYLATQIRSLNPDLLKSITASLARLDPPAIAGDPRNFIDLLRGFRGALSEAFASTTVKSTFASVPFPAGVAAEVAVGAALVAAPAIPAALPVFSALPTPAVSLPAAPSPAPAALSEPLQSHLGRALILSREPVSGAPPPVRAALVAALHTLPTPSDPKPLLFRYTLDLGGTQIETYSSQRREPGDFAVFQLDRKENHSGNSVARFQELESLIPPVLRPDYAGAGPSGKAALLLAVDTLKPYLAEPGFPDAARDFSRLLVDTGRLTGPSASLPGPDELEALFKLMLAFPRDADSASLQARAWSEVVRNPGGFEALLRLFRPDPAQVLLDPKQSLRPLSPDLADSGERPSWTPRPGEVPAGLGTGLELRWDAALQADRSQTVFESGPGARPIIAGGLEKFLHQAMTVLAPPREEEWKEGQSRTLYFFHGDEWKQVEARWSAQDGLNGGQVRKPVDRPPVRVDISLQTENLGSVRASLSLDRKGSKLDFRSERADVRDLLAQTIHPLEHLLRDLDLRLASWTYTQLTTPSPIRNNNDPAVVSATDPASTLDIFG